MAVKILMVFNKVPCQKLMIEEKSTCIWKDYYY